MTIQKVIERVKKSDGFYHSEENQIIIQALKEVEQYRALGTVEKLKEAREKQVAKKPKVCKTPNTSFGKARTYYVCPNCSAKMCCDWKFCFECGQALKWGEEE